MADDDENNWSENRKLVRHELEKLNTSVIAIQQRIDDIRQIDIPSLKIEIAMLKVKAGFWGLVGGAIPVCLLLVEKMIFNK